MFLRWLHKSWKYFWRAVMALLLIIVIAGGALIGILQLPVTENYLIDRIQNNVEKKFYADLQIKSIDGFLPFNISMHDVVLVNTYEASEDTVIKADQLSASAEIWGLLQNELNITGFSLDNPEVWIHSDEEGRRKLLVARSDSTASSSKDKSGWFSNAKIVASSLQISNGILHLQSQSPKNKIGNLPQSFSLTNIDANFFAEWGETERYFDISSFRAEANKLNIPRLSLSGQLYSNEKTVELNSFYLNIGESQFVMNGQLLGVNLIQPNLAGQLANAQYNLGIKSKQFYLSDLQDFIQGTPSLDVPLSLQIQTNGTTDSLHLSKAELGSGESFVRFGGAFQHLRKKEEFHYQVNLEELSLQKNEINQLTDTLFATRYKPLKNINATGTVEGSVDSLDLDLKLESSMGNLTIDGESQLNEPYEYSANVDAKELDLSAFAASRPDTTSLNINTHIAGHGFSLDNAVADMQASVSASRVNNLSIDFLTLTASLNKGLIRHDFDYKSGDEKIKGSGRLKLDGNKLFSLKGTANNINLKKYLSADALSSTKLNTDYNVLLKNLDLTNIYGQANIDVHKSVIAGDSVQPHQFYVDLNAPGSSERSLRLTSSLFDMNISGDISPGYIIKQYQFWAPYLRRRFKAELLLNDVPSSKLRVQSTPDQPISFKGNVKAKKLKLLKKYMPSFPDLYTDAEMTFDANTDGERLLLSARVDADSTRFNKWTLKNIKTEITANARSNQSLKDGASVDWKSSVGMFDTPVIKAQDFSFDLALKQDSLTISQHIKQIGKNARYRLELDAGLSDSAIAVSIPEIYVGNQDYAWRNVENPSFTYNRKKEVEFKDFRFQNNEEYLGLKGTLSKDRDDSLSSTLKNIQLKRISDLIKGEIDFDGILNGELVTRSLNRKPTVAGHFDVNQFKLNDRIIGDLNFQSRYNKNKQRFDTKIDIRTDSTKYGDYLESNDGIGQDITLNGYVKNPQKTTATDSLYYFDVDLEQIDLWVLPLFLDNIFKTTEGVANGNGYIVGNTDDIDFHADFNVQNVFAKPKFVNTNYFLNGPVQVDRHKGVTLDSLNVTDTKGGSGLLWGNIDLNDFKPLTYIDLNMELNELQFLNNKQDPDVPFFGNASGTGMLKLSGSNKDMYMRTPNPLQVASSSELTIPLIDETELNENNKFIQFVDTFDDPNAAANGTGESQENQEVAEDVIRRQISNMSFTERFDLDLQFETNNDIKVNLLFDPVTGEELTAEGKGQMSITMQDQNLQMFGRYTINDGKYQFVTGEIISRRLELEPGGTIVWEGTPSDARLDMTAVYKARPNVANLTSPSGFDPEENTGQEVPVELLVEITGTLNSVTNDYYFRLPSSIDLSSNSTLQYTINQINRDNQQKLLQATSILFTGQFIPTQGTGNSTASLSKNLTKGSTVLNPLLSNQVISPLLSNQINSLINSDVSEFDVDFNLNAYNEVDLGIALRLYNDRLIFRREGRITGNGSQTTFSDRLGDLNATYRINRGLSLNAFHRQDQVLNSFGTSASRANDITPSVDGIGLETNVQYNSWNNLFDKIKNIFGGKEDDPKKEENENADSRELKSDHKKEN